MTDRSLRLGPSDGACYWRCGRSAESREHLIPEWIDEAFMLPDGWAVAGNPHLRTHRDGIVTTKPVQRLATRHVARKSVCIPCNTRWMSDLEKQTKPLLTPLIRGHRRSLDHKAQLQIAVWACMKAAVADARPDSVHGGLCSESIRSAIFERHEPPIDMAVWLAAFDEGHAFALYNPFGTGTGSARQDLAQWITTFVLGHVLVQVLGRTGSVLPGVLDQSPGGVHDGRRFTVWPPQTGKVEWPPRIVLGSSDLPGFLNELCPQLEIEHAPLSSPSEGTSCTLCGRIHGPLRRSLPTPES